MATPREIVAVPFVGGVDTKTDAKLVLPTKLLALENGEFTKGGSVKLRNGYTFARSVDSTEAALPTARHAIAARDNELVLITENTVYSYNESQDHWISRGFCEPETHRTADVAYTNSAQTRPTLVAQGNFRVAAWEDSRGGVRFSAWDTNGTVYASDVALGPSTAKWPLATSTTYTILICYVDTANSELRTLPLRLNNFAADVAAAATTRIASGWNSSYNYSVDSDDTNVYISYALDGIVGTGTRVCRANFLGVLQEVMQPDASNPCHTNVFYDSTNDYLHVGWLNGTTLSARQYEASDLTTAIAVADTYTVTNAGRFAVGLYGSTGTAVWVETAGASADLTTVTAVHLSTDYVLRHAYLASSAFRTATTGKCKVIVGHSSRSGLQNTYYIFDEDGNQQGSLLPAIAGAFETQANRPILPRPRTNVMGLEYRRLLTTGDDSGVYEHPGIKEVTFFADPAVYSAEVGDVLYLTGHQLWSYDGERAVEAGFHMFPDVLDADIVETDDATGNLETGKQYNYRVYYEWYNARGERSRSAAIIRSITVSAPTNDTAYNTLTIPTLSFTQKNSLVGATDIAIVVYRTEGDADALYYRASSPDPTTEGTNNGWLANDPTADTVTFIDNLADSDLISREFDYLNSGQLPNLAPLPCEILASVGSRLFVAGGEYEANTVGFSKLHDEGVPFSDGLTVSDGPEYGGRITGIGSINNTPVVFKENAIFALAGDGPNNVGLEGAYFARPVTSELGCRDGRSIVVVPAGLVFQSQKGLFLLDQGFNLSYVGADVEAYNDETVVAAHAFPDLTQVVFLTAEGSALNYDYQYGQWGTFTQHAGKSATIWRDADYVYLGTDGTVKIRDTSAYTDGSTTYPLRVRTAPLHLRDTIQGFGRLRKFQIVGSWQSQHTLLVNLYYNREPVPYETLTWTPDVLYDSVWGTDVISGVVYSDGGANNQWGDSDYFGGPIDSQDYNFEHKPKRQKFATISFEFIGQPAVAGAQFELTELALEVGLKGGLLRLAAARKE